jgi:RNA polymerase sigma-70 factor (ECF subfamily)
MHEQVDGAGMMVNETDETLMLRVGTGDHAACRELVERHLGRIVAFAGRVLSDRTTAEDVAQDVFLRLWSHARRWRPTGARLTTWLHRVALNLCLDRLARRRETPLDDVAEPVDPEPSAAALLQEQLLSQYIAKALNELPDSQRVAITLCHYQGLRNREAAQLMDLSVEALESLLARGRRTLKARLRDVAPDLLGEV